MTVGGSLDGARAAPALPDPGGTKVAAPRQAAGKPRSVGLDVMRFAAVMMVLYCHANMWPSTRRFFWAKIGWFYDAISQMRVGCWVAIDLFFVLSGFLISGLFFQELKKTGDVSVGRFLVRRGFKIYPAFWMMILVTVIVRLIVGWGVPLKVLLVELFFIQNYSVGPPPTFVPSFWGITWSLGVEEHFYFLMAGLVFLAQKICGSKWPAKIHLLPKIFLGVAIGCVIIRLVTCLTVPFDPRHRIWFLYATHARMDALFFGVLLSYYWHNRWDESFKARLMKRRWLFAFAGVALLFPAIYEHDEWFRIFGYCFTYLGSGYLMFSMLSLDGSPAGVCTRAMAWLGRHSYCVYLWHVIASTFVLPHITFRPHSLSASALNLLIYYVLCWSVGVAMSLLVEIPTLRFRDRWFPWIGNRGATPLAKLAVPQQSVAG